ncbi:hypothetical protein [Horticoccus sp. 23ND18S-11]|uniref:hypothetical protein n=1 Tax=Horticoccus sp. 23ND18S-11 TaxID=3391832 RepID=UPI0039C9BB00
MASVSPDHRVRFVLIAGVMLANVLSPVVRAAGTVITTLPNSSVTTRKPPVSLASLPTPQTGGALKVLLVDDDASENNLGGDPGMTLKSDEIYRELISAAVGGVANAWSVEVVKARQPGPAFERLRAFNLIVWYTGGAYGGNYDTLGRDDEAALRRYLEEVGGAVVIISPGYVNNLVYGQSWDAADHPFLKEVLAVNGCLGLAERGVAGTVTAHDGSTYTVAHPGAAPTLFSFVHSNGAALVFTHGTRSRTTTTEDARPVAVANAHGRGRIVYAGFTVENVPDKERARAFGVLLSAATGRPLDLAPVASVPPPVITEVMSYHAGWRSVRWTYPAPRDGIDHFDVIRRENGQWRVLAQGFTAGNATGSYVYEDRSFCATDTAYRVAVVTKDGRRAEASADSFSIQPDPAPVINVMQSGPNEVTVAWGAGYVPGPGSDWLSLRYLVQGPGLPAAGQWVDTAAVYEFVKDRDNNFVRVIAAGSNHRSVVLKNVPLGKHQIRVTPDYGVGTVRLLSPNPAILTVEVLRWSGPVAATTQTLSVTPAVTARPPVTPVPAPTATQLPAPGTGAIQTLKVAPPGPVPQLFKVTPINPAGGGGYTFSWTNVGDPQFRTLYRIDGDKVIFVAGHKTDTTPVANPAGPFSDSVWTDEPWIYPGTVFRLEVRYQDGRRAETELTYTNPPLPPTPHVLNLQAVQTGHRRVRVSWTRRSASTGTANSAIRITGSGLNFLDCTAPRGAKEQWVDFDNVREGSHFVTSGMQEVWGKPLPGAARVTFDVRPISDRLRVTLLGFRVERKTTDDDIFDGDGRGDEVFFTAFRALVSLRPGEAVSPARPLGIVQSVVMGDTNGFADRQRLGNAGPTGGIRSGDAVPSEAALAAQPGLAVSANRLPLLLWEGRLPRGEEAAVIVLNGWEWDTAPAIPPNAWADRCNQVVAQDQMAEIAREQARHAPDIIRYQPLSLPDVRLFYGASTTKGGTRPLGGVRAGPDAWDCIPQGIVLTLRNAEALLGTQNAAVVTAPLAMKRYSMPTLNKAADEDPSQYTAILQIERLPMTDEELRTYSGMWVAAGFGGK